MFGCIMVGDNDKRERERAIHICQPASQPTYQLLFSLSCDITCDIMLYLDYKLIHTTEQYDRLHRQPNYKGITIYSPSTALIEMAKSTVSLYKPRYVGITCLSLSKTLLYNFHYNEILKIFNNTKFKNTNVKLCMTDTDSLLYSISLPASYVYDKLRTNPWIDFSNYKNSPLFSHYYSTLKFPAASSLK